MVFDEANRALHCYYREITYARIITWLLENMHIDLLCRVRQEIVTFKGNTNTYTYTYTSFLRACIDS